MNVKNWAHPQKYFQKQLKLETLNMACSLYLGNSHKTANNFPGKRHGLGHVTVVLAELPVCSDATYYQITLALVIVG